MDIGRYCSRVGQFFEARLALQFSKISLSFSLLAQELNLPGICPSRSFLRSFKFSNNISESLILAPSPRKRNTCWQQRAEGWPAVTWICEKIAKRLHGPPIRKEQTVFGEPCFKPFSRGAIFPPSFFLLPSPLFSTILSHRILFSPFHDSRFQETRLENARTDYARDG